MAKTGKRSAALWTLFALSFTSVAQAQIVIERAGSEHQRIARGSSAEISVAATNAGSDVHPAFLVELDLIGDEFTLSAASHSPCGPPVPVQAASNPAPRYRLNVGSLAANERRECRVRVTRGTTVSNGNAYMAGRALDEAGAALPGTESALYNLGTIADVALRVEPVSFALLPDGRAQSVHRFIVHNFGPDSVYPRDASACALVPQANVHFDVDLPGGCTRIIRTCSFDLPGTRIVMGGPLASGQSASCLARATTVTPFAEPLVQPFLIGPYFVDTQGGSLPDTNGANDRAQVVIEPLGTPPAPMPVPALSAAARSALGVLLAALAVVAVRRRRTTRLDR